MCCAASAPVMIMFGCMSINSSVLPARSKNILHRFFLDSVVFSTVLVWLTLSIHFHAHTDKMISFFQRSLICLCAFFVALAHSQKSGYVGYKLETRGDNDTVIFSTDETRPDAGVNEPDPDVYLNATVHVGTIDIEVDQLVGSRLARLLDVC